MADTPAKPKAEDTTTRKDIVKATQRTEEGMDMEGTGWETRDKRRIARRKERRLKIASMNCKGLNEIGKRQQIREWMREKKVDILMIQETKIKEQTWEQGEYNFYNASEPKEHLEIHREIEGGKGKRGGGHGKGKGKGGGEGKNSWKVKQQE